MQSTDDSGLLRQYAENGAEDAFTTLVSRHINLVYSVAFRIAGNSHHAEEITQAVFIILAKKAVALRHEKALSSWLFGATRLTANNFARSEARRQRREQEAYMQSVFDQSRNNASERIAPLLDDAVEALSEKERRAIILRFYEGKNLNEVGIALGISEEAAKKRVMRAVEKLQRFLLKRGVASATGDVTRIISAYSVQAAPAALAKSVTAIAIAKGAAASASTLTLIKGALKIMAWTKAKTVIVASIVVILAAGTTTTLVVQHGHQHAQEHTEFPRASWASAGYADPVSAFETSLWAATQGDWKTLFDGCSPRMQGDTTVKVGRQMMVEGKPISPEDIFTAVGKRYVDGVTGFRIDHKAIYDDKAILQLQLEGRDEKQTITMKKIGDDWKIDDIQ